MEDTIIQLLQDPKVIDTLAHIKTLNEEMGQVQIDVAILQTQMASVLYWGRYAIGALGVLMLSQGFQHFQMRRNGKK